jgi:methionine-rich copper-binding protein CopC
MRPTLICSLIFSLVLSLSAAQARTASVRTNIGNGQVLGYSPFEFTLVFDEPVRLRDLTLIDRHGAPIKLAFKPTRRAQRIYAISMPVLPPDHYRISWRATTEQGGAHDGRVRFSLEGCDYPVPPDWLSVTE